MGKPDIDAGRWSPPRAPALEGPYARNGRLEAVERWELHGVGPEDVAFDEDGNAYTGVEDGRVLRFGPGGSGPEVVVRLEGRPLGIERDPRGGLIVCAGRGGLLHLDPGTGELELLVRQVDGRPMLFCNNAAVTADGARIYFSDSSQRYDYEETMADVFEHSGTGRFLVHDRDEGTTAVLRDGLYLANGVALAEDDSFVLVAETERYRITRWWLTGDEAGTYEPFVENLPGMPDNLTTGAGDIFWVALVNPRNPVLDRILPYPRIRELLWKLPDALHPPPTSYGFVLGLDRDGRVVHNLQGPSGKAYARITSAREHDGHLYLGSIEEQAIGRVPLPT